MAHMLSPREHQQREEMPLRILCGTANRPLAEAIAKAAKIDLTGTDVGRFADGEINISIKSHIRGCDVFILQPCPHPDVNGYLMESLLLIHTLRLSSAARITVVYPYFPYARQDLKVKARVPIAASAVAQLIETMGAHRVLTVDLHSEQIQGFFQRAPVDNLFAEREFITYFRHHLSPEQTVIVSPDAAGVPRARRFADMMHASSVATIMKRGPEREMEMVGNVQDKFAIIVDDMIDTGRRVTSAAALLKQHGAAKVFACATHGIFSADAIALLNATEELAEVYVTDTIPQAAHIEQCKKIKVISVAQLLAQAIHSIHVGRSISSLFDLQASS